MDETDKITIKDLTVRSRVGIDLWGKKEQLQPIIINITLYSRPNDDPRPIEYETFCNHITAFAENSYKSIEILAEELAEACVNEDDTRIPKISRVHQVSIRIEKPRALLHAASVGVEVTRTAGGAPVTKDDMLFVKDLRANTILGVPPWEREQKQPVLLNLNVYYDRQKLPVIRNVVKIVSRHVEGCNYQAMESLAASVARIAITECKLEKITVRLEKPSVLTFASSAGVEITRTKDPSKQIQKTYHPRINPVAVKITRDPQIPGGFNHIAFITTRSDKIDIIYESLKSLEGTRPGGTRDCAVLDTSFLYQSKEKFLHIACKVATNLSLEVLQAKLKVMIGEMEVIFYDDDKIPDLDNREFVLKPLCDVSNEFDDAEVFSVCDPLLTQLLDSSDYVQQAQKVIPIGETKWCWKDKTFVMGILEINNDVNYAVTHAKALVEEHVNIIDIGGMWDSSEEEESERLIPIIKAIRASGIDDIPISINTHRATIANRAIAAGANIINDYSGGTLDPNMYSVMAEKSVPVFLQHRRREESTYYEDNDVVSGVCTDLNECVKSAIQAGVRTWNIIINPGLGCSKDASQDHQILRRLSDIIGDNSPFEGFPCAVGVEDPAVCTVAIAGGADILRVSDMKGVLKPIKVADDIYKR